MLDFVIDIENDIDMENYKGEGNSVKKRMRTELINVPLVWSKRSKNTFTLEVVVIAFARPIIK